MRIIALLLLGLTVYFAVGLFRPARYEGPRYVPPAAADSPAMRALRARPLPADDAARDDVFVELVALQQHEDATAYARWMQARAWRAFLGRPEPALADVGAAIDAGRDGEAGLAALRADVLAAVVAVRIETALAPALLDLYVAGEDMSRGRVLTAVAPGLWSIDAGRFHAYRVAVKVRNLSRAPIVGTPLAPLRLVIAWDGERDKSVRCESPREPRLEPGIEVTFWCRSMADLGWTTAEEPVEWLRSGAAADDHRLELVAEASSLAIPALGLALRRGGNDYRTPELDRAAEFARHRAGERGCHERGTCLRDMFARTGQWRATCAWALAALAVCAAAATLGRWRATAVLLALLTTVSAGMRALVAGAGDVHPLRPLHAAVWIAACAGLVALAWSLRAPLSDWRAMRTRPHPAVIHARWAAAAGALAVITAIAYAVLASWALWSAFRR
ncbi:hypothetical protein [Dokdonella fugitiva]|uniref:Uncharacterized protein n=1 Tax=Dokdonella fugitiva TaxID=328517 RepID=A0A4R2ID31_9GAMM|nr:hypothetical protein [Dokdonella fugitiva]TCO41438.1 hypothetical protein EV148_103358 [Dokdonella fugitiva]